MSQHIWKPTRWHLQWKSRSQHIQAVWSQPHSMRYLWIRYYQMKRKSFWQEFPSSKVYPFPLKHEDHQALILLLHIMLTNPCNEQPGKPHREQWGLQGYTLFFLDWLKNTNSWCSSELPHRCSSNEHPQSMFGAKYSHHLAHCCRETLKGVHRQTVLTQIRRRMMWCLIWVSNVCWQQFFSRTK